MRGITVFAFIWKDLEKPDIEIFGILEVEIYRKWICIICVIEMSGTMLGSMPEVVQRFKSG